MKKVWAVAMVKNESDIIESFCRYTLCYADGIIIQDDKSTDATREIIKRLVDEGLNIILFEERFVPEYNGYGKFETTNAFIKLAIEEYGADLVIPLDADEFIICRDNTAPRIELEKLDESVEHQMHWRSYIYEEPPTDNSEFLPYHSSYFRNPKLERLYKTFISKKLFHDFDCSVTHGNHNIIYSGENRPPVHYPDNLLFAHYPIRSKNQLLSKIIIGELNYKCLFDRKGYGVHWNRIYEQIKQAGNLDAEQMKDFSMTYDSGLPGLDYTLEDLTFNYQPLSTDYLEEKIVLKYTNYNSDEFSYLNKILAHVENIILNFKNREIEVTAEIESYKNAMEIANAELSWHKQYVSDIKQSRSWKLARKIQKIYLLFSSLKSAESKQS